MWGKIIGGVAGLAFGGPFGAVVGAALGHAAESGALGSLPGLSAFGPVRQAALLGNRDQLFAVSVVLLSAKLARCDGPVKRVEIDAFKRGFNIPPDAVRDIGRLFDHARESEEDPARAADQLGAEFAATPWVLENVLGSLFAIARADGEVNMAEAKFLRRAWLGFSLSEDSWEALCTGRARRTVGDVAEDPYAILGVARTASDEEVRGVWRNLMRESHPDSLASRGVSPDIIAKASEKVARINAAWDLIKRDRKI